MPDGAFRIPAAVVPERMVVVPLPGEVDVSNEAEVRRALAVALETRPSVVIADGTRTEFFDCAAVATLVGAHKRAATAGVELRVVITSERVQRVLELIGAETVLPVYPSLAAAQANGDGPVRP
jgi:anti-sigma B factor antagonist